MEPTARAHGALEDGGIWVEGDLGATLDQLDQVNPEAATMCRELVAAIVAAEHVEAGSSRELVAEYHERWPAEVLDVEQLEEVRAWLASR